MLKRLKDNSKDPYFIFEAVLAFFLPLLVFACAYYLGTKDTKIPVELTLRYKDFDIDLFRGIANEISYAGDFSFSRDIRSFFLGHFDPFFLIALLIPASIRAAFLYIAYFVRIGLASLMMFLFINKQVPLKGSIMVLLSVCYSLAMPVITISSYTAPMDAVIMLPILFGALIEYMRDASSARKGLLFSLILTAALYVSGCLNLLSVLPLVIFSMIFVSAAVGETILSRLIIFLKSLPYLLIALGFSAFTLINTVTCSDMPLNEENLLNFEFRTTMFDFLLRFLNGKAVDTSLAAGLGLGMTIFVLVLLILFFFNSKIPLRLRVMMFFMMFLLYLFYSSRVLYRISLLFVSTEYNSAVISASRFAFVCAILIFAAAITWRNIAGITPRNVSIAAFAVVILVVLSNNSKADSTPSFFSMYFTGLCAIVSYFLIKEREKIGAKAVCGVVLTGLTFNLAFVLPISSFGSPDDVDSAIFDRFDRGITEETPFKELDFFEKDNEGYLVLYNFSKEYSDSVGLINNICAGAGVEPVFIPLSDSENLFDGGRPMIDGLDMMEGGKTVTSYKNIRLAFWEEDHDLVAYTNHKGDVTLILEYDGQEHVFEIEGPSYLIVDTEGHTEFTAKFLVDRPDTGRRDRYALYTSDHDSRDIFTNAVKYTDGDIEANGPVTILTGRRAGDILDIRVDGENAETYELGGKIAIDLEEGEHKISINESNTYLSITLIAVAISIICSIVLLLWSRKRGETIGNV